MDTNYKIVIQLRDIARDLWPTLYVPVGRYSVADLAKNKGTDHFRLWSFPTTEAMEKLFTVTADNFTMTFAAEKIFEMLRYFEQLAGITSKNSPVFVKSAPGDLVALFTCDVPKSAKHLAKYVATDDLRPLLKYIAVKPAASFIAATDTKICGIVPIKPAGDFANDTLLLINAKDIASVAGKTVTFAQYQDSETNKMHSVMECNGETFATSFGLCGCSANYFPDVLRVTPDPDYCGKIEFTKSSAKTVLDYCKKNKSKYARLSLECTGESSTACLTFLPCGDESLPTKSINLDLAVPAEATLKIGYNPKYLAIAMAGGATSITLRDANTPTVIGDADNLTTVLCSCALQDSYFVPTAALAARLPIRLTTADRNDIVADFRAKYRLYSDDVKIICLTGDAKNTAYLRISRDGIDIAEINLRLYRKGDNIRHTYIDAPTAADLTTAIASGVALPLPTPEDTPTSPEDTPTTADIRPNFAPADGHEDSEPINSTPAGIDGVKSPDLPPADGIGEPAEDRPAEIVLTTSENNYFASISRATAAVPASWEIFPNGDAFWILQSFENGRYITARESYDEISINPTRRDFPTLAAACDFCGIVPGRNGLTLETTWGDMAEAVGIFADLLAAVLTAAPPGISAAPVGDGVAEYRDGSPAQRIKPKIKPVNASNVPIWVTLQLFNCFALNRFKSADFGTFAPITAAGRRYAPPTAYGIAAPPGLIGTPPRMVTAPRPVDTPGENHRPRAGPRAGPPHRPRAPRASRI